MNTDTAQEPVKPGMFRKNMKLISISIAAVLLCLIAAAALAGNSGRRLSGTWLEANPSEKLPRAVLHFKGSKVRFENYYGTTGEAKYKITDRDEDGFTVAFEFISKLERPSGEIQDYEEYIELRWHTEEGRPILSEMGFEHGGRGPIVMAEFLRKDDYTEGFESELKKERNARHESPYPSR